MKRQSPKPEPKAPAPQKWPKDLNALPVGSKQLLKKGNRKQRAILSPSQPHSKTFGH